MTLLNPKTEALINAFTQRPYSSVMLIGSDNLAVFDLINTICTQLLSTEERHNIVRITLEEPNKNITVEQIRDLKKQLVTSIQSNHKISRIIIIQDFQTATNEAQNALLKVLEEPAVGTVIIIQAEHTNTILSTVQSRVQTIPILPLRKEQARAYAASQDKLTNFEKFYLLSQGESKLFQSLIHGTESQIIDSVRNAKLFLGLPPFERLQQQKQYEKHDLLQDLIRNLERIASAGLHTANQKSREKWATILHELRACGEMLEKNVLVKLVFIRLCISL